MPNIRSAAPNQWDVAGGAIRVRYSTLALVGPAGGPHLFYQDGVNNLTFSGDQIRVVNTPDLGSIVSVTIALTVDSGSTTFSLFLPQTNIVQQGPVSSVPVSTEGVITHHAGALVPPILHGQNEFYKVVALRGTASHILVA
jgi:hypothetical protein